MLTVSLAHPSLQNNIGDADRLAAGLKIALRTDDAVHIDLTVLKKLPELLRKSDFKIQCVVFKDRRQWSVLDVRPAAAHGLRPGSRLISGRPGLRCGCWILPTIEHWPNPASTIPS
jgi:hypothetical protein